MHKQNVSVARKIFFLVFLTILLTANITAITILNTDVTRASPATEIIITPSLNTVDSIGDSFTLEVNIVGAFSVYLWQVYISFDPTLLNVTKVKEGDFLRRGGAYKTDLTAKKFNTQGYVAVIDSFLGEPASAEASGSGTLAEITFITKVEGTCTLHLYQTRLRNYLGDLLTHTTRDGSFQYPPPTKITIDPASIIDTTLQPGTSFDINLTTIGATEVYSWSLNISWDKTLLNISQIQEGPFLNQVGAHNTSFTSQTYQQQGYAHINCSLHNEPSNASASGTGILATITFLVNADGACELRLSNTKMLTYEPAEIIHTITNGYFKNLRRDIAITNINLSSSTVAIGETLIINVTAKNNGTISETFNVAIYYSDYTLIETKTVTNLGTALEIKLTFSWNTVNASAGSNRIRAVTTAVSDEADTRNNILYSETFELTSPAPPLPWTTIITAVVVIAIIGAVAFLYLRRRGTQKEKQ